MTRLSPLAAEAVIAVSDGKRAAMVVFLRDGVIDAAEQAVIDALDLGCTRVSRYDNARRVGDWIRDTGTLPDGMHVTDLSPWLQREWRDLHRDDAPDAA